ncbi:MAG TPA: response regulator transcription factor [Verrucomicrobiae bacterium]|jgi:two-component system OmpR family response regulator|nr:response regulator transcription factor [Verrucomicrobiae bacterium]
MRILLIEDDPETSRFLIEKLSQSAHNVTHADNGEAGLRLALSQAFDVLIVDRLLPQRDGLSLVAEARAGGVTTPVLFLTGLSAISDRVDGLALGDDYLVKPFSYDELAARIAVLGRRNQRADAVTTLRVGDLILDRIQRTATRGGELIELQARELQILELLMLNADRVVTRTMLLEQIWRFTFDPGTNLVESHVSRLRTKIDRGRDVTLIHTIRGAGYVIRQP